MRLNKFLWPQLNVYLTTERKLSSKTSSRNANKSRFLKLASYFTDQDFTKTNFNAFIDEMRGKNYAPSYVNNTIKMAKHVDRFLNLNQLQDYTYFFEPRKIVRVILTPKEIQRLAEVKLAYKKMSDYINQRQQVLILLMGTTGCRSGEALGLTFDDIGDNPPHVIFRDTKSHEDRVVPIGGEIHKQLLALPKRSNFVFASGRGGLLEGGQVNLDLKARAKIVGIGKIVTAHLLRHSYITEMLENGCDWLDLSVIVGHKNPATTLRYKQSLIGHYVGVTNMHPLLRGALSIEEISRQTEEFLSKRIDTSKFNLHIEKRDGAFKVTLRERNVPVAKKNEKKPQP